MSAPLTVAEVQEIADRITRRQQRFTNEDFTMSVGVVLMNFGDRYVRVDCIAGEWSGTKSDLARRDGIPLCPNGHPLLEVSEAPRLGWIDSDPTPP